MSSRSGTVSKSRNGCLVCKKRKVKCDEARPKCQNCARLQLYCVFESGASADGSSSTQRRTPGRPRKIWHISRTTSEPGPSFYTCATVKDVPSVSQGTGLSPSHFLGPAGADARVFNSTDLELLTHFSTHTAPSIAAKTDPDHSIGHFWAHNVPQMALTSDVLLHLLSALAARHKCFLLGHGSGEKGRFTALAEYHHSTALARMNIMLPQVTASTASALYIASMLLFYCICAAGPTSDDDLFICTLAPDLDSEAAGFQQWVPLIRGVSAFRHEMMDDVYSSPLMAPLHQSEASQLDRQPSYIEFNFPRVAWSQHLRKLSLLLPSQMNTPGETGTAFKARQERAAVLSKCFNVLEAIYRATFGDDEDTKAEVQSSDKFVFKWLYLLEDTFIDLLQQRDAMALLLLAYYAPLLRTMETAWYLHAWPEHLIRRIHEILGVDFSEWMNWPRDILGIRSQ